MVGDLGLGVDIAAVPTVREPDGLAVSSRNVFLSADQRRDARALSAALRAGAEAAGAAAADADAVLNAAHAVLDPVEGVDVEYLELRGLDLGPAPASGPARLLVAAQVGNVRLIDNIAIELG
jgi:pantoate--beta-alanine ligase